MLNFINVQLQNYEWLRMKPQCEQIRSRHGEVSPLPKIRRTLGGVVWDFPLLPCLSKHVLLCGRSCTFPAKTKHSFFLPLWISCKLDSRVQLDVPAKGISQLEPAVFSVCTEARGWSQNQSFTSYAKSPWKSSFCLPFINRVLRKDLTPGFLSAVCDCYLKLNLF